MCMFSSPKTPSLPAAPSAPPPIVDTTKDNAESKKARSDEERRAKAAKGRNSTILTSPLGIQEAAPVQKATVLGYTSAQ